MDTCSGTSPRENTFKGQGQNSDESLPGDCSALREDVERNSTQNRFIQDNEKCAKSDDIVQTQAETRQKSKLFRRGKKLTKNLWTSMDGSTAKKNRVLKSEKSMDDSMLLARSEKTVDRELTHLDTVTEEVSLESFNAKQRRGSICEELEKEIFQDGMSLHEMRKAMVIEETLKERFLM